MENSENEESDKMRKKGEMNESKIDLFKDEQLVKTFVFNEDYSFLSK